MKMLTDRLQIAFAWTLLLAACVCPTASLRAASPPAVLIANARVFDGTADQLAEGMSVLVESNIIARVSKAAIEPPRGAIVVDAGSRVLMPGLIDTHTHLAMASLPLPALTTADPGYVTMAAAAEAERMLMRGVTTIRDMGGPTFGLKRAIDEGLVRGPRIYPSGHVISQTAGHGDFRLPQDQHPHFGMMGELPHTRFGFAFLADGRPEVLAAVRETLRRGATQIKVMAGGGINSPYDSIDVMQYTEDELRAAVEAAEAWGTYVVVHAYSPEAIRHALSAGALDISHANLIDEATMKLLAEKGAYLSAQVAVFTEAMPGLPAPNQLKLAQVREGLDTLFALAKKYQVKLTYGTDLLGGRALSDKQTEDLVMRSKWFTPVEVLRQATSRAGELVGRCGKRNPYPGKLGVVQEGALADLLLVNGNPLQDLSVLAKSEAGLALIMKGGIIFKNTVQ
jgi:imidazolonepropionase-like amidohydrolase